MASTFLTDLHAEQELANFLDKFFYNKVKESFIKYKLIKQVYQYALRTEN